MAGLLSIEKRDGWQSNNFPMMTKLKEIQPIAELRLEKDWLAKMKGWFFDWVGQLATLPDLDSPLY
jgi:hypothetical protein